MKIVTTTILALMTSFQLAAAVDCTQEPKEKWKNEEAFKKELEASYKIKLFKTTVGNCYEIYGWNKAGKKVEIYFNPVTGAMVKEKVEK